MPTTKRAPSGKKKLVTLHVDGANVTPGLVGFLALTLGAVAVRSQSDLERISAGEPMMQTNSAGDLVVYVNSWSV